MVTFLVFSICIIAFLEVSSDPEHETKIYNYSIGMRRKYLSMRFNSFIRIDGDPTERDVTVTWLRNITESIDMEVLYIVQTPEGDEVISKSFEPPTLCTGSRSSNNWDRNIVNIGLQSVTTIEACPIEPKTIIPPYSFDTTVTLTQELVWETLHFILDFYPVNELDSAAMLVLEGRIRPL